MFLQSINSLYLKSKANYRIVHLINRRDSNLGGSNRLNLQPSMQFCWLKGKMTGVSFNWMPIASIYGRLILSTQGFNGLIKFFSNYLCRS